MDTWPTSKAKAAHPHTNYFTRKRVTCVTRLGVLKYRPIVAGTAHIMNTKDKQVRCFGCVCVCVNRFVKDTVAGRVGM